MDVVANADELDLFAPSPNSEQLDSLLEDNVIGSPPATSRARAPLAAAVAADASGTLVGPLELNAGDRDDEEQPNVGNLDALAVALPDAALHSVLCCPRELAAAWGVLPVEPLQLLLFQPLPAWLILQETFPQLEGFQQQSLLL